MNDSPANVQSWDAQAIQYARDSLLLVLSVGMLGGGALLCSEVVVWPEAATDTPALTQDSIG
jgi:hypothetical protein